MKNLRVIVDVLSSNVYPSNIPCSDILSLGYSGDTNVEEEEILCVVFTRYFSEPDPDP